MTPKIMNEDRWEFYKEPYKVGDKFIFPEHTSVHPYLDKVATVCKGTNLIGEISLVYEKGSRRIYKLDFDFGFPSLGRTEEELDKLERVQ